VGIHVGRIASVANRPVLSMVLGGHRVRRNKEAP
jgi:hypothetical protein